MGFDGVIVAIEMSIKQFTEVRGIAYACIKLLVEHYVCTNLQTCLESLPLFFVVVVIAVAEQIVRIIFSIER
jgi:hypothetical protein